MLPARRPPNPGCLAAAQRDKKVIWQTVEKVLAACSLSLISPWSGGEDGGRKPAFSQGVEAMHVFIYTITTFLNTLPINRREA